MKMLGALQSKITEVPKRLNLDAQDRFILGYYHQTQKRYEKNQRRKRKMADVIKNRYEFVILFDVENGNPNGDPDAGNLPRIDPESGYGIVTDVCIKRKIRNYVETVKEDSEGYKIYIKEEVPLNRSDSTAYDYLGTDDKGIKDLKKKIRR